MIMHVGPMLEDILKEGGDWFKRYSISLEREYFCKMCHGSGEGYTPNTRCQTCKGTGTVYVNDVDATSKEE